MTSGMLLAAFAGALIAGGVVLGVIGLRRVPPAPARPQRSRRPGRWSRISPLMRWAALAAFIAGWFIALGTGWFLAIPVLPIAVLALPALLMVSGEAKVIARLEAMAEWTRGLAGVLTAGRALEGALEASLRSVPEPIRPEVTRLVARLRARWPTDAALRAFADDLDDATGDLVCAALMVGANHRGEGLAAVLAGLADSVGEDVRARRQVEADRSKPRAVARQVTLISLLMLVGLGVFGNMMAAYHSPVGQVILAVLLACYGGCLWWLRRMSIIPEASRFLGVDLRGRGPA